MKEKPPAFQWYPKDFLSDEKVIFMSMAQRGVYITLLSMCWVEKSLPNDPSAIALKLGAELADVETVCGKCFEVKGNRLKNRRLERERRAQRANKKTRSKAGKKGAKARWQTHGKRMANASEEDGNAIDLPLAKNSSSSASATASKSQSQSQKREASLSQPVEGDSAKQGGDALEPGVLEDSRPEGPVVTGGGSQEAGPPPICDTCGTPQTAAEHNPFCSAWRPATAAEGAIIIDRGRHIMDSHELGQPSRGKSTLGEDLGPSAKAAPFDGAGGVVGTRKGESSATAGKPDQRNTESGNPQTPGVTSLQNAPVTGFKSRPAPTPLDSREGPTEDPLFNRLHAWFTSKRIGGSCKHVAMAYQQFMSMREALILKSRWSPIAFEESWVNNGWDAAFAAGRQAGELQYWLRDYDPDGTAGEWKKGGAGNKPRRVAGGWAGLTKEQADQLIAEKQRR